MPNENKISHSESFRELAASPGYACFVDSRSWRNKAPADLQEVATTKLLVMLERAIRIQKYENGCLLCTDRMTRPPGANEEVSDLDSAEPCIERAKLILEWVMKLQHQPVAAPVVERDLTHHPASARQVGCETIVLVKVANGEVGAD